MTKIDRQGRDGAAGGNQGILSAHEAGVKPMTVHSRASKRYSAF